MKPDDDGNKWNLSAKKMLLNKKKFYGQNVKLINHETWG